MNPPTGKTARSIRRKKELIQPYCFQKGPSNTKQQQSTSISFSTIFHLRASSHYSATIFYCFSPSVLARVALEFFSQNSSLPYLAFHLKIPPLSSSILYSLSNPFFTQPMQNIICLSTLPSQRSLQLCFLLLHYYSPQVHTH